MPSSQSARGTEGSSHRFAFNPLRKPMRSSVYSMISFLQAFNMTGFQFSWVSSDRALTEPFLADLNMDGRPDLVANTDGGRSARNNTGSKLT
mmetsp:Transcript_107657/g.246510  ORF Transcript_107657/g.246510 Transcript_107657/m.246510 type:complete len:92 (+) Transcript_107657:149-424(+)